MKTSIAALVYVVASVAAAQTFHVSGTVVDSESGSPLSRTRVALSGGPVPEQSVITNASGSFSFNVPQGKYTLTAAHRDFGQSYGQSGSADSSIITGPDLDTSGILMRWRAPVAIHGKVVDESGDPVHDAKVELFVEAVAGGKKRIVSLGNAESDEFGDYSWSSLPAGTYYLAATGAPWYFSDPMAKDQLTEASKPPRPYALTYFPSGPDPRGATPLTLRPGAQARADFMLRPANGANLHFACPSSACYGSLTVAAVGIGGAETSVAIDYGLEANVMGILPGRYVIRYSSPDQGMRKEIVVAGGDMTVAIEPKPIPKLAGAITFEKGLQPRHPLYVNILDEETGKGITVGLDANGGFAFPALPVSRVRMLLTGSDGFFIKRMSVEGASVRDGLMEIVDGASVHVTLNASGETGRVAGVVVNADKPVPMVTVVLAPTSTSTNPAAALGFQTDSDGSFEFDSVPAGEYVLFAVEDQEFEYANPVAVRPFLTSGKRISIEPHSVQTERIGLASEKHNQ